MLPRVVSLFPQAHTVGSPCCCCCCCHCYVDATSILPLPVQARCVKLCILAAFSDVTINPLVSATHAAAQHRRQSKKQKQHTASPHTLAQAHVRQAPCVLGKVAQSLLERYPHTAKETVIHRFCLRDVQVRRQSTVP